MVRDLGVEKRFKIERLHRMLVDPHLGPTHIESPCVFDYTKCTQDLHRISDFMVRVEDQICSLKIKPQFKGRISMHKVFFHQLSLPRANEILLKNSCILETHR